MLTRWTFSLKPESYCLSLSPREKFPLTFFIFLVPDKLAPFPSGGTTWEGLPTNELVLEESVDKKHNILLNSLQSSSQELVRTLPTCVPSMHGWRGREVGLVR